MPKLESDYKTDFVKMVRSAGGYARRVEDQYAVGTLDLIIVAPGTEVVLGEAKRFTHLVYKPSPRQYVEMQRIENAGGLSVLIGIKDGRWHFHRSTMVATVDTSIIQRNDESPLDAYIRWYNGVRR